MLENGGFIGPVKCSGFCAEGSLQVPMCGLLLCVRFRVWSSVKA